MASVRKQIHVRARPDDVWRAIRDFGALHTRVVPRFVLDTELDGDTRIVTFANGTVQREPLVDSDDELRRLVYSAVDSPTGATHYNASVQVFSDGQTGSRIEWIVDVLPHNLHDFLDGAMDQGAAAMKRTLDGPALPL
jgi:carbon monoxide dehydrogenase subunit G